jgi:hypothetical protein
MGAMGLMGLPGSQGDQGEPGPSGPSGIVTAISFVPAQPSGGVEWVCEFGATDDERLDVQTGERSLITGQATVAGGGSQGNPSFSFAVAWREVGDDTNGNLGHIVQTQGSSNPNDRYAVHVTELTPPLDAATYEFGLCVQGTSDYTATAGRQYGTVLLIAASP